VNGRDRRSKLSDIAAVADSLRSAPIDAPDFTRAILDRVDAERPFLAASVRRRLPWVYASVAGVVCASVLAVCLAHRYAPPSVEIAAGPRPVSEVVRCVECSVGAPATVIRESVAGVGAVGGVEPAQLLTAVVAAASLSEADLPAPPPAGRSGRADAAPPAVAPFVGPVMPLWTAVASEPAPRAEVAAAPAPTPVPESLRAGSLSRAQSTPSGTLLYDAGRGQPLMSAERRPFRTAPLLIDYEVEIPGLPK
jgi:hypothetical protein